MSNPNFIHFENVCKYYNDRTIIAADHVSFDIAEGEFVVIVGPSGAGKTTILNILGGMDSCDEGIIRLGDREISSFNKRQLTQYRRVDVGFVFPVLQPCPEPDRARERRDRRRAVRAPARRRRDTEERRARGPHGQLPGAAFGGEQQRVSIARALAKNPQILLCDEPTGALDYNTGKAILKLLWDTCRSSGKTVIVITHNSALTKMADRVIHIKNGSVQAMETNDNPTPAEEIEW